MEAGAWLDSESEEQARETQVFKIGECLRPFYLAAHTPSDQFETVLPREILFKDTDFFLKQIGKTGFFPSPYSPIPGSVDQYTDFAAFVLEFCGLVHGFWQDGSARGKRILVSSKAMAENALDFLLTPETCLLDENGCRWGGTNKYRRVRRTQEIFTDTYFTSVIVLALNGAIDSPALSLSASRKEEIRNRIRQARKWIADRFDGKFITGDEGKSNRKLLYTTWGLRALVETFETQDSVSKKLLHAITNAYLDALRDREAFTYEQEYLTILSEEVDQPLYYEDRSGLGGILLTLASLRDVSDLEHLLEETSYARIVERVFNSIMTLRNPGTGLWYNQQLILSIHSYLTEAFIGLDQRGKGFGGKLEVSGYMIRAAVKETLIDETVISSLQQAIYDRLLRLVEATEQGRTIEEGVDLLLGGNQTKARRSTKGSQPRDRNRSTR
jgi:hypothetical protein